LPGVKLSSAGLIIGDRDFDRMTEAQTVTQLRRLMHQRDQLLNEIEALRNQVAGLDMAIGLVGETPAHQEAPLHERKIHVSETIVALLREAGETGLKARATIELAADRGINLNRGSVYSLLSRMTRNGIVVHEDTFYKLSEFARRRERNGIFLAAEPPHSTSNH